MLEFAHDIPLLTHILQDKRCKMEHLQAAGGKVGLKTTWPKKRLMKLMTKQIKTVQLTLDGKYSMKWKNFSTWIVSL